jgi:hypothetical protein
LGYPAREGGVSTADGALKQVFAAPPILYLMDGGFKLKL